MVRDFERELTAEEKRFLSAEINRLRKEISTRYLGKEFLKFLIAGLIVGGVVYGLFGKYPWHYGLMAGGAFVCLLFPITTFSQYTKHKKRLIALENAKAHGRASIRYVEATAYASFREFEDLGVLFVFQIGKNKLFVLRGQEYYGSNRFPCLNFEMVTIQDVHFKIDPKSQKVKPIVEFDDKTMRDVCSVKDQSILEGELSNVLEILRANQA